MEDLTGEVWKPVVGLESDYEISSKGRLRAIYRSRSSLWRNSGNPIVRLLSPRISNGYYRTHIGLVHRLVARAFCDGFAPDLVVNHLNGVRTDNRPENLEWCTPKQNAQHAWETGLCNEETRAKMSAKAKLRTGNKNSCWRGKVQISKLNGTVVHIADDLRGAAEWVREHTQFKQAAKGNISLACNGKRGIKKMYGHYFSYIKEVRTPV